jgi:hypothetical protein
MRLGDVDAAVVLHAASVEKRDDEDIVLAAVGRFPKAIQFASKRLRANARVIQAVAEAEAALQLSLSKLSERSLEHSESKLSLSKLSLIRSSSKLCHKLSQDRSSSSAAATTQGPSDPLEEAEGWQTFSCDVTATGMPSEIWEVSAYYPEEAHLCSSRTTSFGPKQQC